METFSEVLRDLIIDSGLSLRKLQIESGVSATQYGRYLKGAYPTLTVAEKIAKYFNCSFDYLFGLVDVKCDRNYGNVNLEVFVERYEEVLRRIKMTHWKFAHRHGFSESCLRHWKYGEVPKVDTLIIIASNLCVSIDYLLGRY